MSHHQHVKYLLIGGGLASSSAAKAIRTHDHDGSIQLIGQEPTRPYHRPPLSKDYLRGIVSREALFTDYVGWFRENHIDLHTGLRAVQLDARRRCVSLDNGDEISFEKLLIATGGSPKHLAVPGSGLANVHYLRNLSDADRLHNAIEKAKNEGRPFASVEGETRGRGTVTVIGGGLLGVELAATLSGLGLRVNLVVAAEHPWKKFASESIGKYLVRYLEKNQIKVHLNAEAKTLEGDGRVQRVVLTDGQIIPCDFVVAAIGMLPNKDLLRGTPIAGERSILVDDHCRTSVPDIYAAGDCAALFDPLFGKHRQLDHWDSSIATGTLAGHNMAGADFSYDGVSHFTSKVFDLDLSVWGDAKCVDRRILRGVTASETPDLIEIGVAADGRIAQILTLNHRTEDATIREWVRTRFNVLGKEDQLRDPQRPLSDFFGPSATDGNS